MKQPLLYESDLSQLKDWDEYLLNHSNLPGPRANLELAYAVAKMGEKPLFLRYLNINAIQAPQNSSAEFLPVCGTLGLGLLLVRGDLSVLPLLHGLASDPRWRIREGVVLALELWGESNLNLLFDQMDQWMEGNFFEIRAAICALSHPKFLKSKRSAFQVLKYLDDIMQKLQAGKVRKTEDFRVLRLAMGYCWSVAVAASPLQGKGMMQKWIHTTDRDLLWIIKSNLSKNRIFRMDANWVRRMKELIEIESE